MLDRISGFIQQYKGAPVLLGTLLVILNFVVVLLSPGTWMASTNLLLHVGIAIGLLGILLGDALGL